MYSLKRIMLKIKQEQTYFSWLNVTAVFKTFPMFYHVPVQTKLLPTGCLIIKIIRFYHFKDVTA